jgi:hypothetical protein
LKPIDFFGDGAQSIDVFCMIAAAFLVSNYCKPFSQGLRQIGQSTFHRLLLLFSSLAPSLSQQLALRFEPIGLRVTRQSKSAPPFGNKIGSEANGVL